jgi:bifunctional DNase/RNase
MTGAPHHRSGQEFLEMKVTGLTIDPFTSMPIIILKDIGEKCALPIWIGLIEASSIATELGAAVRKVAVHDLADNTFYANIVLLDREGREVVMDARPSDAIAMALRTKAPIFVARSVIEKSRKIDLGKEGSTEELKKRKWAEILENLSPEDFGKYKM